MFGGGGQGDGDTRNIEVEGPTEEAVGVLEYTKEGNGWLRKRENSFQPDSIPNGDTFVPSGLIRSLRLQEGSEIVGQAGLPNRGPQRYTLTEVESVDGEIQERGWADADVDQVKAHLLESRTKGLV